MVKLEKKLQKMRNNPKDWSIEDLKVLAKRVGLEYRQPGSSHVTFRAKNGQKLTVPASKRIKPIYVKLFLELVTDLGVTV